MEITRRAGVASILGLSGVQPAAADTARTHPPVDPDQPLRTLGALNGLSIGTAVDTDALAADSTYVSILASQFGCVTPENVMKWQLVEPTQGTYDWAAADTLLAFAKAHGQRVRGHCLVCYNQLPDWLNQGVADGTITATELNALLKKHITDEVSHFRGRIWQWDVVNEVFDDDGTYRDSIWYQYLGADYIENAFRWAHEADPKALLFYNDYNIEGPGVKSTAVLDLVTRLRSEGVPIHGVGIQGHLGTQYGFFGADAVAANMRTFTDLGLDVAVTEADVRSVLPMDNPSTQAQSQGYNTLMQAALMTERCISFTVWEFADQYSWVPSTFTGQGSATLYDDTYTAKPAYTSLQVDMALSAGRRG